MAAKKVEVLEAKIGQLRSDFKGKFSNLQGLLTTVHEKIDGKFANLEDMMRLLPFSSPLILGLTCYDTNLIGNSLIFSPKQHINYNWHQI